MREKTYGGQPWSGELAELEPTPTPEAPPLVALVCSLVALVSGPAVKDAINPGDNCSCLGGVGHEQNQRQSNFEGISWRR